MEREILFRGKTKAITGCPYNNGKDGEWVFGYVFSDLGAMKIRQYETDRPECNDYEVDPETVGQFTGLYDANGAKVFEGDIVKAFDCIYVVMWDNVRAMFYLRDHISRVTSDFYNYFGSNLVVIGNVHDNPKMLNATAKDIAYDADAGGLAPATENFELMGG